MTEEETTETQEEIPVLATGLSIAFGYSDAPDLEPGSRRRGGPDRFADLRQWQPKTRLGRMVMNGEILNYNQAMATGLPIREVEIIDALIPNLEEDVLAVNMIQRMTDSGRRSIQRSLCGREPRRLRRSSHMQGERGSQHHPKSNHKGQNEPSTRHAREWIMGVWARSRQERSDQGHW